MASVLYIAPLPPPITGQSLASQVLYDDLVVDHDVKVVNLSKQSLRSGFSSFGRFVSLARLFIAIFRNRDADVIYFTISESRAGNLKDLLIYLLCYGRLNRMVVHLHGGAGMRCLLAPGARFTRAINAFFLSKLRSIVILGERHRDIFAGLQCRTPLAVVANFAAEELFVSRDSVVEKFQRSGPLRVLYLSNLIPGKGYLELLRGYELLSDFAREQVLVDFAGAFESNADQAAFLNRIQALPNVKYHGVVMGEQKASLLKSAHVFCLPTYYPYEGQPISILEAYATGCAVITTDHSGILDVFSDGENGMLVRKMSSESVRDALATAANASRERLLNFALRNLDEARVRYRSATYVESLSVVLFAAPRNP